MIFVCHVFMCASRGPVEYVHAMDMCVPMYGCMHGVGEGGGGYFSVLAFRRNG